MNSLFKVRKKKEELEIKLDATAHSAHISLYSPLQSFAAWGVCLSIMKGKKEPNDQKIMFFFSVNFLFKSATLITGFELNIFVKYDWLVKVKYSFCLIYLMCYLKNSACL